VRETARVVTPYERRLDGDRTWAMDEGSRFFEGTSGVHLALRKIIARLDELDVPYVVVGGMALFQHGVRRFTDDVDILVTPAGLRRLHEALDGRGYVPPFERSRHLRDTELGVKIEFLVTGHYPGDGQPKAIAFPDPDDVAIVVDGVRVLDVRTMVELKLASGLSAPDRLEDFGDVIRLVRTLDLPRDLGAALHTDVRAKYDELWRSVHAGLRRFVKLCAASDAAALAAMAADGVRVEARPGTPAGFVLLVTSDAALAEKYEMHDERDVMDELG
jgi:hypothetical protein